MNELCINALYHSFYGETDELWHKGKMGMHWGRRYYQPYSQGYQAQNKGIFYGTIGKLRGLGQTAKGIGKYYTSGEGARDLREGLGELGKAGKSLFGKAKRGMSDTVSQLGAFGKEVGKRTKDTAIPFLREAGSELGKKAKKGLMTGATYGLYGMQELGRMGKEQIEKGKGYLSAFASTDMARELSSRIGVAKKGAKNAYDKAINASTSLGASILSAYLGGPKGRSREEYSSPKAKSSFMFGNQSSPSASGYNLYNLSNSLSSINNGSSSRKPFSFNTATKSPFGHLISINEAERNKSKKDPTEGLLRIGTKIRQAEIEDYRHGDTKSLTKGSKSLLDQLQDINYQSKKNSLSKKSASQILGEFMKKAKSGREIGRSEMQEAANAYELMKSMGLDTTMYDKILNNI